MTGTRVIESNDSKLALLLGNGLYSPNSMMFCEVAPIMKEDAATLQLKLVPSDPGSCLNYLW